MPLALLEPALQVPLTVIGPQGPQIVVVRSAEPVPWREVARRVCTAAGLPPDRVLHAGPGPVQDAALVGLPPLMAGAVLSVLAELPLTAGHGLSIDCIAGPDAGRSIDLPAVGAVTIGRSPGCDLTIDDPQVSTRHLRVRPGGGRSDHGPADAAVARLSDLGSTNGISNLSGERSARPVEVSIAIGDPVRIGASVLRIGVTAGPTLLREPDGRGRWRLTLSAGRPPAPWALPGPEHPGPSPSVHRRPIPWAATVLGAAAGIGLGALTGMWIFLLMSLLGPVTMIVSAAADALVGRRTHRRAVRDHRRAVADHRCAGAAVISADRRHAYEQFADPAAILRWAQQGSGELWSRTQTDGYPVVIEVGSRPARIAHEPGTARSTLVTDDVPITITLPARGVVGLGGAGRGTLRWLLAQLLASVAPDLLELCLHTRSTDFDGLEGLEHLAGVGNRLAMVHRSLHSISRSSIARQRIILIDDYEHWHPDPALGPLLRTPDALVLVSARDVAKLPRACDSVIDLSAVREPIGVGIHYLRELGTALRPLTVPSPTGSSDPSGVLLETPDDDRLAIRWNAHRPVLVTLGRGRDGPLHWDLDADGPHLLVAGTTGSGKSELLQTLCYGLLAELPPEHLSLLLVDYKGGAAFGALASAPHTSGVVTDLDQHLSVRALRSLRAELKARERFLATSGTAELGDPHRIPSGRRPPRLVVVVDEFATLAADLPDFLAGLLDVAQRGRSLGVHLVLATQRPAGVISPAIRANIGSRICLRVIEAADSVDVIGTADAASIGADQPGTGYLLRAGRGPELLRVARVTAAVNTGISVSPLGIPPPEPVGEPALPQLVAAARRVAARRGIPAPAAPWLPAPPHRLALDAPHLLGLLDRPGEQRIDAWSLPAGSLLLTGPARSGLSSALRRWAAAVRQLGGQLLVIDAGGGLTDLRGGAGVSSCLTDDDPVLVLRLLDLLIEELDRRRRGSRSVPPLTPGTSADPPPDAPIGLLIDGWDALAHELDTVDPGGWQQRLTELIANGPSWGIRTAMSATAHASRSRIAEGFDQRLLFGLPDRHGEPRPDAPPGRCRPHGQDPADGVELQWALPGPWPTDATSTGRDQIVVRRLPHSVLMPAAEEPAVGGSVTGVPLGMGGDRAELIRWQFADTGAGLLVAGAPSSGVSTTLRAIALGAGARSVPVCWWGRGNPPGTICFGDRRGEPPDRLSDFLATHDGPLLLLIDDAHRYEHELLGDLAARFLQHADDGQLLVLGTRLDRLGAFRGPVAELARSGSSLLMGADNTDGAVLGVRLPRRRTSRNIPGRGHLINRGTIVELQVGITLDARLSGADDPRDTRRVGTIE